MTPFEAAIADRQQSRAFHAAIDDIRLDREAFAREEVAAETPRELYLRHFDGCSGTSDKNWKRLEWYRHGLLLLEQCQKVRELAGRPGITRKTANFLLERDFQAAQGCAPRTELGSEGGAGNRMNTMKFYRVVNGELRTLRVKIDQRVGQHHYGEQRGRSRAEACSRARLAGFYRTKREAMSA